VDPAGVPHVAPGEGVVEEEVAQDAGAYGDYQATVEPASKYSTRTIRVSKLTNTPEVPIKANFQNRPAEGTY
jgi:hypothetical protein